MPRPLRLLAVLFVAIGCFGVYETATAAASGELAFGLSLLFLPAGLGLFLGRAWARRLGIGLVSLTALVAVASAALFAAGMHLPPYPVLFNGSEVSRWTPHLALTMAATVSAVVALCAAAFHVLRRADTRRFVAAS
jgi:hypothetical protein